LVVVVLQAGQALQTQPMVSIVVLEQLLLQSVEAVVEIHQQIQPQKMGQLAVLVVVVQVFLTVILVSTFLVQEEAVPLAKVLLGLLDIQIKVVLAMAVVVVVQVRLLLQLLVL
jgi:hypothetical protein